MQSSTDCTDLHRFVLDIFNCAIAPPLCDLCASAVGEYTHQHLAGSALRIMEATGHFPHMSQPEETIQVMKEYLGTKPPPHRLHRAA